MRPGGLFILLTFFIAMMLAVVPLPEALQVWRPDWVALVLIYWCIEVPDRIIIGVAWITGLFMDVLTGALLGQNAFILVLVAYVSVRLHQRTRVLPIIQQALTVTILLALARVLDLWIMGIFGQPGGGVSFWLPIATGGLMWPFVFVVLDRLRQTARIA